MIVVGLPGALTMAGAMTLIQRDTAGSHRGRVFGALGAVEGIAIVAGTVAAGFLGQRSGSFPFSRSRAAAMSQPGCSSS
jgi:MFS family permease